MPGYSGMPAWPANGHHYAVSLLQADGRYDLEHGTNYGDGNDLFRAGYVDAVTTATVPTSSSYSGFQVPPITEISASGETMTFKVGDIFGLSLNRNAGNGLGNIGSNPAMSPSTGKACNTAAFDALLEVITSKAAEDTLRISAMRMAGKIVRVEKDKCAKLSEALAQVIEDNDEKAAIRSEAIATIRHLAK